MISQDSVDSIKQQLKAKAREYYGLGKPDMADKVWIAYEALEIWERQGMTGDIPIDLAEFGLELPTVSATSEEQPVLRVTETVPQRERLRRQAREAKGKGNLATATDLWRQLLEIEPDDMEAQRELHQCAAALGDQSVRKMINELRCKSASQIFSDLDNALALAQSLLTSMELDEAKQHEVQKLEDVARKNLAELRATCGEIETFAAFGHLNDAIARLEGLVGRGGFEYVDRDGCIVSTADKLREINQEYASYCTQRTYEYLERAELSLPAYPKSAMGVLDQAWNNFDKADPEARYRLETRRTEIQELIDRWVAGQALGQALVAQATREKNPELRLGLFLEARSRYEGLVNLDQFIAEAKLDAASAVTNDVRNIYDTGRLHLRQGELEEAQEEVFKARRRASDVRGNFPAMEEELAKIDKLMDEITNAAMQRHMVDATAKTIAFHIQNHNYVAAEQSLAQLSDEIRNLPQIAVLEERIEYAKTADYQLAKQLHTMLRSEHDSNEPSVELRNLARAMQAILDFSALIQSGGEDDKSPDNNQ